MKEYIQSDAGHREINDGICNFLLAAHELEQAAQELLHQGLVLIWSAFEVLCRDAFEILLNKCPSKVLSLIDHPSTRKRFEAERLPLDMLAQHGFNLATRLGTVLVGQQDFSDLPTIKAVFAVLYPDRANLHLALADRGLWTLYQRRHLIVHRRGVVDQAYRSATGEDYEIGSRLKISPRGFEADLSLVISAGAELVRAL